MNKGSSIPSRPDHSKKELGRTDKPLAQMTIQELRTYRDNLPFSNIISDRCMREGRCHACHQPKAPHEKQSQLSFEEA